MRAPHSSNGITAVCAAMLVAVLGLTPHAAAEKAKRMKKGDSRTLHGEYLWTQQRERGSLEAVFTKTKRPILAEDGREIEGSEYDVEFHFRFNGQPHTYAGTATGWLDEGKLEGTVFNENKRREFTFRGEFEDGRFEGRHAEIRRTGERRTGTLWLEGESSP